MQFNSNGVEYYFVYLVRLYAAWSASHHGDLQVLKSLNTVYKVKTITMTTHKWCGLTNVGRISI